MFQSETQIRVRYAETDQMGYVYYGNYAQYYEVARVEALRTLGMSYRELEEAGIMMPVRDMKCRFIRPGRYDELLTLRCIIKELPSTRMQFYYEVINSEGVLINEGETTLVFVKAETMRPISCPDRLFNRMKPFFEAQP